MFETVWECLWTDFWRCLPVNLGPDSDSTSTPRQLRFCWKNKGVGWRRAHLAPIIPLHDGTGKTEGRARRRGEKRHEMYRVSAAASSCEAYYLCNVFQLARTRPWTPRRANAQHLTQHEYFRVGVRCLVQCRKTGKIWDMIESQKVSFIGLCSDIHMRWLRLVGSIKL